ncbi:hypothetical protein SUDANB6_04487 [Streptomyces sp. enrichment culture]
MIVEAGPWEFVRGLVHSGGCRTTNRTARPVGGERGCHGYPRYFFTNKPDGIRRLRTGTLDRLGVEWTYCTRNGVPFSVSVARRASAALTDTRLGPER